MLYVDDVVLKNYVPSPGGRARTVAIRRGPGVVCVLMNDCTAPRRRNVGICGFSRRGNGSRCVDKVGKVSGPSFLVPSTSKREVCTMKRSSKGDSATGTVGFSGRRGGLALLGSRPASNNTPYCVALDPSRGFILATGCVKNDVAIFPLSGSNGLGSRAHLVSFAKGDLSGRERARPRLRYVRFAPSRGYLLTDSLKASRVRMFPIDRGMASNMSRSLLGRSRRFGVGMRSKSKPHRVYFRPGRGFTCLVGRVSKGIVTFSCSGKGLGTVRCVRTSAINTGNDKSVRVSPSKGFLCTSGHLGTSNVTVFSVGRRRKALAGANCRLANVRPHGFVVDQGKQCLLITYESDGSVRMFRESSRAKLLGSANGAVGAGGPMYLGFAFWAKGVIFGGVGYYFHYVC